MLISVIIPSYNSADSLPILLDTFLKQSFKDYEIIVVDDCSNDNTAEKIKKYDVNYIRLDKNSGPALSRNAGAKVANGDILAFTDSDCRVSMNWLSRIALHHADRKIHAVMGKVIIENSTYLGNSISALGFPAGGSLGFDKVWKVDEYGFTTSLSSCNCAVKKNVFNDLKGFDETFPYAGGEDSFLAYSMLQSGFKIKYCPDVIVYHEARDSLKGYILWQYKRGISSRIFSSKIRNKTGYLSLRLWSISNVVKSNLYNNKLPLVLFLLFAGYLCQSMGFYFGKKRNHN